MDFPLLVKYKKIKDGSFLVLVVLLLSGGFTLSAKSQQIDSKSSSKYKKNRSDSLTSLKRNVPNPINGEIPHHYKRAVKKNTRSKSGKPGSDYWQQVSDYDMDVKVLPGPKKVVGNSTITYHNNSPDTLNKIYLELVQNFNKKGVIRKRPVEISSGMRLHSFSYAGKKLNEIKKSEETGYQINGTVMMVNLPKPMFPGQSVKIKTKYDFNVPRQGAAGRMGYSEDNLFYIGYFYPKMRVYDDVFGWFKRPFLGDTEFYNDFGDYNVKITVPAQWIVAATGNLKNAKDVLRKPILNRMEKAHNSDSVVHVVSEKDFGNITPAGKNGMVTWSFSASKVTDFAFSVTKASNWDATRAPVGDTDGDGGTDYAHIDAFYRNSAPLWKHAAKYLQNSITFLSKFTGLSYPWPHATVVEGRGIFGGGMEYPMISLIGTPKEYPKKRFYGIIAHEFGHMWFPLQVQSNERSYGWMDEGITVFNAQQTRKIYFKEPTARSSYFKRYTKFAKMQPDEETELMRNSEDQGVAYGVNSYAKMPSIMAALRNLLGKETFNKAYHTYAHRWRYKHPYPWDFFNTFEDVSGRNLDWFWRSWFYETWHLDQAVGRVEKTKDGSRVVIEDKGQVPMPATIEITLANGHTLKRHIKVDTWLNGAEKKVLSINNSSTITKVVIDPEHKSPDVNRKNNVWEKD